MPNTGLDLFKSDEFPVTEGIQIKVEWYYEKITTWQGCF